MATPPDFSPGQVLTAAHMDAVGLWLVKTQTVGTGVSSVTVTDAFSADYYAYKIIISDCVGSTAMNVGLKLGASATGYYHGVNYISTGAITTPLATGGSNEALWTRAGAGDTNGVHFAIDIVNPNLARHTTFFGMYNFPGVPAFPGMTSGIHQVSTAYTAFDIVPSTGTITGGTIRVYGYRN